MIWRTQLVLLVVTGLLLDPVAADEREDAIRRDVMAYFDALKVSDFSALTSLTCPAVVNSVGGASAFIARLQTMDEARRAQQIEWGDVKIQSVSETVVAGPQLHTVIKVQQQISLRSGKTKKKTYMLGVSEDDGQSWTFVDATKLDADKKKELFPEFNDELKLPGG